MLLVDPTGTKARPNYRAIDSHAGGIAWYGNYLYVAETNRGVRVFDLRNIFDLGVSKNGTTRNRKRIGLAWQDVLRRRQPLRAATADVLTASQRTYWFTRRVALPPRRRNRGRLVSGEWTAGGVQRNREDVAISKGPEDLSCWRSTSRLSAA